MKIVIISLQNSAFLTRQNFGGKKDAKNAESVHGRFHLYSNDVYYFGY